MEGTGSENRLREVSDKRKLAKDAEEAVNSAALNALAGFSKSRASGKNKKDTSGGAESLSGAALYRAYSMDARSHEP